MKKEEFLDNLYTRDFAIAHLTDKVIAYIINNSEFGTDYEQISLLIAREIQKRFS